MLSLKHLCVCLALVFLAFGPSQSARAQKDCAYGFKIYLRDGSGKSIENAKLDVTGLTKKDKVPAAVKSFIQDGAYFVGALIYGSTLPGDFLLSVSAEGFETYKRQFNFPACEVQSFELKLLPTGSTEKPGFDRLFTVHGKVFDEEMKPFGSAKVEATYAGGKVYQTTSNAYGYYRFDLPKGAATIRVTDGRIPDVIFEGYKVEKNYSVLNVPVCLKCKTKVSKN